MLPQRILDRFARIPRDTPIENEYYGVFNKILAEVCFADEAFTVVPQYYPLLQAAGSPTADRIITFVVELNYQPIFFLEIKPLLHVDHVCTRVSADTKMRAGIHALRDLSPTPRLHGVSAMGQRLAFYRLDKTTGCINPTHVEPSDTVETVPAERWDTDITTEEGYQQFMAVINDVKTMAAVL